eukprot:5341520-Amphidinium_carterae.1
MATEKTPGKLTLNNQSVGISWELFRAALVRVTGVCTQSRLLEHGKSIDRCEKYDLSVALRSH